MNIQLQNTGKRFNREWIFRHLDYQFLQGYKYAITGSNGSGKSTLLQILAGATQHNEGAIIWQKATDNAPINGEQAYQNIAIAAPYLDLVEEISAIEFLQFHSNFKQLTHSVPEVLAYVGLQHAAQKQIRYYSSGMKQRLKLAQAFFTNSSVLLLDEPTTNLDADGIQLFQILLQNYTANKLVIISSNDEVEYQSCDEVINLLDFK